MFNLHMGNDGIERGFKWIECSVNDRGLAHGRAFVLNNDYKKNSYELSIYPFVNGVPITNQIVVLEKGKDEVLTPKEFEYKYNALKQSKSDI